jgi:hypothetical protein
VGYGLSVAPQSRREDEDSVSHALRSSGLLHLKVSWARVFQSGLKNSGGTTQMVHVASSWMLRRVEAKDGWVDVMGYIRFFYPNFVVFYVFSPRGILVL